MKKLFKPIAVFFSAALLLTSCIDNEVSDQVNRIREAQVNLLNARVRLAEANAEAQEISNAYNEALNAIDLEERESDLEVAIAENQAALVEAQVDLEEAELDLQEAIDALADYLETNGLNEAAGYLVSYNAAMVNVFNTTGLIYAKEEAIAILELFLTPVTAPANAETFALWEELLQRDLSEKEALLAAQESALAILEAVQADPSAAQTKLAELSGEVLELNNQKLAINVEVKELTLAKEQANDAVVRLTGGLLLVPDPDVAAVNPIIPTYETAVEDSEDAEAQIAALELTVANLNVTLTTRQANLANAQQLLDNYTNELVAKFGTFNTRLTSAKSLGQTLKDKITELDILEAQGVTGTPLTTAQTAVTNAITPFVAVVGDQVGQGVWTDFSDITIADVDFAINNPVDTSPTSTTDLQSAADLYNGAKVFFNFGQPAHTLIGNIGKWNAGAFIANFELNGTLDGVPVLDPAPGGSLLALVAETEEDIEENTNGKDNSVPVDGDVIDLGDVKGIAGWTELKAIADAKVAELQDAYDDANAALPDLRDALKAADDALTAKNAELAGVNALLAQYNTPVTGLIAILTTQVNDLNDAIETKKNEIEVTRGEIANLEADIAKVGFDVAEVEAKIAQEEAELARLQEVLAVYQAQAAGWKALLDAALD